jgi:hypothetical protein
MIATVVDGKGTAHELRKMDELPDDSKFTVNRIVAALLVKHSVELAIR